MSCQHSVSSHQPELEPVAHDMATKASASTQADERNVRGNDEADKLKCRRAELPKGATMYNVAVDVGGTFTDVLVFDEETGGLTEGKVLSTPEDPSKGVVEGIEAVCEKVGISFLDLHLFFHGTTVVTNMILTNTGSRVGLLTTKGHKQILHLARA